MRLLSVVCVAVILLPSLVRAHPGARDTQLLDPVCVWIAGAVSSASSVHYPGDLVYAQDIAHFTASSSQLSKCSVEPATASDVAAVLKIVGSTRTPFAVKGGGHTSNPGFSSTPGVHIAMSKFVQIAYHADTQTVDLGAGLIWDDVYATLEPLGVNVVGGRVSGVGIAGFTLGGGYSWKTSQHGLTIDTVVAYELVKPDGTIATVTQTSDPGLFFALKGGFNNFGIVTKFTLQTFPQTQVWGGVITYTEDQLENVNAATAKYAAQVTDPKAAIITAYNAILAQPGVSLLVFYDAPTAPGIFDDFLAIPSFTKDVGTQSFLDFVKASPSNITAGQRGIFNTASVLQYTPAVINAILNETKFWGAHLALKSCSFVSYAVEPFLPSIFTHGTSASAYPSSRVRGLVPTNIYYVWSSSHADADIQDAARQSAAQIRAAAVADGQDIAGVSSYGNYAIFDTPLEDIYGVNVPRLKAIKVAVDPGNVMGLAGGFKF